VCFATHKVKDGQNKMQSAAEAADMRAHANSWALSHKKMVLKAPLPAALEHRMGLWFQSLRSDQSPEKTSSAPEKSSSAALTKDEMAAAMEMGANSNAALT
jgi:hypothetical protein